MEVTGSEVEGKEGLTLDLPLPLLSPAKLRLPGLDELELLRLEPEAELKEFKFKFCEV